MDVPLHAKGGGALDDVAGVAAVLEPAHVCADGPAIARLSRLSQEGDERVCVGGPRAGTRLDVHGGRNINGAGRADGGLARYQRGLERRSSRQNRGAGGHPNDELGKNRFGFHDVLLWPNSMRARSGAINPM